jgi:acetyl-CoA carboxylase carboxyltransferase component
LYTDVAALFRRIPDDEGDGRRSAVAYLAAYLRDLDAEGEGLPEEFLDRLGRVLGHYGVTRRRRTRRLEESLFRLHKAHRRLPAQAPAVLAILERRLAAMETSAAADGTTEGSGDGGGGFRPLLDRLIDQTQAREPAIHDLAREVRYQLYDRPLLAAARRSAVAAAAADLDALGGRLRGAERARRVAALVDNSQPIEELIAGRLHGPGADLRRAVRRLLLEVLLLRAYRGRDLGVVTVKRVGGIGVAEASYREGKRTVRVLAAEAPFAARAAAAAALAERCAKAGRGVAAVVELLLWHPPGEAAGTTGETEPAAAERAAAAGENDPQTAAEPDGTSGGPDAEAAALAETLAAAGFPPTLERAAVTIGGRARRSAAPGAAGAAPQRTRSFTFRPDGEGGFSENALYRGLHPATAERLELWRLSNFDLERLPAGADDADVYLFRGVARDNPRDERLFAVGEVRDATPVTDAEGRVVELPELERMLMEALAAIRRVQSRRPAERRLLWNRVVLYVWPLLRLTPAETEGLVRRLAPRAEGHGLQKVAVRTRVADRRGGPLRDRVLEIGNPTGRGLTLRLRRPADRPLKPLDEYARRVVAMRRRGLVYPYELIRRLTSARRGPLGDEFPPPGEFVEHDLDGEGSLVPVDRPWGRNTANLVVGLIRSFTREHPEGMARVIVLGDPSRGMGSLADPECSRVVAALDLAERLGLPVEWFALSAGAEIAMDSGTENMDAIARVLRRIVGFTQAGGEINVVVGGVNVGAQPYWNAEATMLMHTRGVLIMTPSGTMVLTGKKALDYSGGVSAEDNQGIGGYERIMGPNGQAQYFARDLEGACRVLLDHYRHAYVAPGERFPRPSPSHDPRERDVREFAHHGEFATVGEVFSDAANPGRKRPFEIRRVMRAVTDQDHEPRERWYGMEDAEVAVVWDAHLGGHPVSLVGFESKPLPRFGFVPADGPRQWTAGTLFPLSSKKVARAINAASGNRPLVVLANLSGFDGSPESLRRLQLEYGAEIGRAVVNFRGPLVFCVVSRYHGGAFVVFSRALNDQLQAAALEGSYASVIGGAPAAAVVFAREVEQRARRDPRVTALERELTAAEGRERAHLAARFEEALEAARSERLREVAEEFDAAHSVERAQRVGSIEAIIPPARLRPWLIEAVERGIERELAAWSPPAFEPVAPRFERRAEVFAEP